MLARQAEMFAALTKPWGIGANPACSGLPLISRCPSWLPWLCCCWGGGCREQVQPPPTSLHQCCQGAISKYTQISCVSEACCRALFNWRILNDILRFFFCFFFIWQRERNVQTQAGAEISGSHLGWSQQALTSLFPVQHHICLFVILRYFALVHCTSFTWPVHHFYLLQLPIG